jgi:hypothetical protein
MDHDLPGPARWLVIPVEPATGEDGAMLRWLRQHDSRRNAGRSHNQHGGVPAAESEGIGSCILSPR